MSPETCPPLNLSNGMVPSSENRTVGTVITFSCNPGKQVSEDIATACFPGGNWSAPNLPTCVDGTYNIEFNDAYFLSVSPLYSSHNKCSRYAQSSLL